MIILKNSPLTINASKSERRGSLTGRKDAAVAIALLAWIVIVAFKAAGIVGGIVGLPVAESSPQNDFEPGTVATALITIAVCMTASILARLVRPDLVWPALGMTSGVIILTTAMTTGSLWALVVAIGLAASSVGR